MREVGGGKREGAGNREEERGIEERGVKGRFVHVHGVDTCWQGVLE